MKLHCKVNGEHRVVDYFDLCFGEPVPEDIKEALEDLLGGKVEGAILSTP